ncbi:MAG: fibronectin/fibrinogen-binding protein [Ruminococcaceae bacterium]|nr:fibronectin/fibrinogen-binding protein [Oscillospiraceae bacterium]
MAFDAGMVSAIVYELNEKIRGARVEKVTQPEKDEIVLLLHAGRENLRLALSSGSNNPHFNLTAAVKENPLAAPMFCMLLRKHLTGARISAVTQLGFERAVEFAFDCYDEMGFAVTKYIVTETMGKYSNIILLNQEKKVISALKIIDLATSNVRQILPGFPYELPPEQKKLSPLTTDEAAFRAAFAASEDIPADKFILGHFYGFAAITAREIAYRAGGAPDVLLSTCTADRLWESFTFVQSCIREHTYEPWLVMDASEKPVEYCFFEPLEYGAPYTAKRMDSFGSLLDEYFGRRDHVERIRQRTADIFRLLTNAETRLTKKLALQKQDLAACADKEKYKLWGDLITGNIYRLSRGMEEAVLENYYEEDCPEIRIPMDKRLAPQQNAQRYYKKYTKSKTAEVELAKQIKLAEAELAYIYTVFDSLTRAESESDILEIRDELYRSGYASRMKNYAAKKLSAPKLMAFRTTGGYRVLCGKNNHQNDHLTTKLAGKQDYWFHVKNQPGSHCVLFTEGEEPSERDFTEAAIIAAYYSKVSEGVNVPVDYTLIRNIRKPAGSKPGFVTYSTNYTAYVTPDEKLVQSLRAK